jgi:hypothetical protein
MQAEFYLNPHNSSAQYLIGKMETLSPAIAIPEQVHGNKVQYIDSEGDYSEVDGLITDMPGITLVLKVADCVPVYIFDAEKQLIALVHSGWRGTVHSIVPNVIRKFIEFGSQVENIHLFLGPAICKNCFEVGENVAEQFEDTAKSLQSNGKWLADLHQQIIFQCLAEGVFRNHINASSICTFEDTACHSYRRDGENAGRMIAAMRMYT